VPESSQHRGDAIFALPRKPRSARLFGHLPGWREDLRDRGVAVVEGDTPELAVASSDQVPAALACGSSSVVVDSGRAAFADLRRAGLVVRTLLPIPIHGSPILYVDLDHPPAARYGIATRGSTTGRLRLLRDRIAGAAAARGVLARAVPGVAVAAQTNGAPALLAAARELGVPEAAGWNMIVSPGSAMRRNAFLMFSPGSSEPDYALKFSRVPGLTVQFEREERGVSATRAAGGTVGSAAPDFLGRVEVDGHHASLETAARGVRLAAFLRGPAAAGEKLDAIEQVVRWLEQVARETASPPETLDPTRARLSRDVMPDYSGRVTADLVDRLPRVPSVFCHNDPSEENIVQGTRGMTLLDWEWAERHGLPLADLVYFGAGVLRILDGVSRDEERAAHFVALMQGRAPSSERMFAWVERMSRTLELPRAAVGPLVTLGVLDHGYASRRERHRFEQASGAPLAPAAAERFADAWLSEPGLGAEWPAWHPA
jgi:hypothetical protein